MAEVMDVDRPSLLQLPVELIPAILPSLSLEDRCRVACTGRGWRDECRVSLGQMKRLCLHLDRPRKSFPHWLLRLAPQLDWIELGGNIFTDVKDVQAVLQACTHATWADLSRLRVDQLALNKKEKLHLVPPASARCAGFPVFGLTDLDRQTYQLARHAKLEVLYLHRPVDEAAQMRKDLSSKLFDDIATYLPQCSKAWPQLRALSVECQNEIVIDVDRVVLFPCLQVLALRGQFSLLDVFALTDTGSQDSPPRFAPALQHAVFGLGHGLSELVTKRCLRFPDLSRHSKLKTLIVEEHMLRLPIPMAKLPRGLQALVICVHDIDHVGPLVRGDVPNTLEVVAVQIGSRDYKDWLSPYFTSLESLNALLQSPCSG